MTALNPNTPAELVEVITDNMSKMGQLSAKSRLKGKTKKQISEIMRALCMRRWEKEFNKKKYGWKWNKEYDRKQARQAIPKDNTGK